jgi:predicted Zn-dependent protease
MASASRLNDSNNFPYLRSHPLTTERIGEARSRLGVGAVAAAGRLTKGPLEHAVMRGRARVLMDLRAEALGRIGASDAEPTPDSTAEHLAAQYAVALAAVRQRDWTRADAAIKTAAGLAQAEPGAARQVNLLRAESLIERGDAQRAGEALAAFAGDSSRPVRLLRARQTLMGGVPRAELQRSADELQTWVALYPQDALAWDYAAQSWDRLGQPLRAVRAQAEARVAIGDLEGAVDRLRSGQRLARQSPARDSVEASVIEARLRDVQGQRRRELADERGEREPPPDQQQ